MSTQAGFDLNLDASSYVQSAGQALATTTALDNALMKLSATAGLTGRGWNQAAPSRQHLAALGGFTAAAAAQEQQLQSLNATQAVTGQRSDQLARGIRSLAREMPVGQAATQQTVQTIQQLGVSAAGQEQKVISLSRTMTQLAAATGGFSPQMATGMTQLERTFGDQGLDPKRIRATSDALVTVSKSAGASAQGTLDFANAIGPIAQSAGIGKTATLGIGAAFNRIGQDGTSAATAVNKMLSDMSRAVRDGGPEMATYADIVGTTADQFERLFKNNPAQALTQVTQAIGKNPQQGPRMLEQLGLEGPRTQRALQAISASGGLQDQINTALGAYGNDNTKKASEAAFKGVIDDFQRAGTAAAQLGAAIGTPLLRPLGAFAGMLAHITGGAARIADTRVGRDTLTAAAYGGIGILASRRLFGAGLGAAAVRQGLTSGPVLSGLAGYRSGQGRVITTNAAGEESLGGVLGRPTAAIQRSYEEGALGEGRMGGVNTRVYGTMAGIGQRQAELRQNRYANMSSAMSERYGAFSDEASAWREQNRPGAPRGNIVGRGLRGLRTAGLVGVAAYNSVNSAQFAAATTPAGPERDAAVSSRLSFLGGAAGRAARDVPGILRGQQDGTSELGSRASQLADRFRQMGTEINNTNRAFPNLTRALSSVGRLATDTARFSDSSVAGAARVGAAGIRSVGSGLLGAVGGGYGAALTGGMMLGTYMYQQRQKSNAERQAEADRETNASPTEAIDKYNEAMGRATSSTSSYTDAITTATKAINNSVTDVGTATTVRPQDVQAAQANPKVTTTFGGTNEQIASQIRLMSPTGMDPSVLNSVKVDLLRQMPQDRVQAILGQLGPVGAGSGQTPPLSGGPDIRNLVTEAANRNVNMKWGRDTNRISSRNEYSNALDYRDRVKLKPETQADIDTISGSLTQRYASQQDMFGGAFAQQQRIQDINAAMDTAARSGNEAVVQQMNTQFQNQQFGISDPKQQHRVTSEDIQRYGGYVQALAHNDPKGFGAKYQDMLGQGMSPVPGQGLTATPQRSHLAEQMQGFSFGGVFDNTLQMPKGQGAGIYQFGQGPANVQQYQAQQQMQASLLQPDDLKKASDAVQSLVNSSQKAGTSLSDLAGQTQKAAVTINDSSSPAFQRLMQSQQEVQFRNQAAAPFRSSGQNITADLSQNMKILQAGPGDTPETQQSYNQARQGAASDFGQIQDQLKQRIAAERQYQIQSSRAAEDYNKQVTRSNDDFQRSQLWAQQDFQRSKERAQQDYQTQAARSTRDFNRQTQRAEQDYQTQTARSYEDYYTQRQREERDFQISMTRGQEDYLTQRSRAIRDFNKQLNRQIEDQAQGLYDPYQRIQTQAVWDAKQLMANLSEQGAAVQKQRQQLDQVRRMGLSNETIQSLGLNDPKNAQQLNQLVNNFLDDPSLVKQLNATAAQRLSMSKLLVTDPSNKELARAREDFATQLADMESDYNKMVGRARADMSKQLADQAADFGRTMSRMAADFNKAMARQAQDFHTAMNDAANDFNRAMARQDQDYQISVSRSLQTFQTQMSRMRDDYNTALGRMRQDVDESEKEITGDLSKLWDVTNQLMKNKSADTNKVMKDGLQDTINFIKDPNNAHQVNDAYKNLFPYDLSKVFGTGGPAPGQGGITGASWGSAGNSSAIGGPDAGHQPMNSQWGGAMPHGGPYRPIAPAGGDLFAGQRSGGMGILQKPATITQAFGEQRAGEPDTGGGWPVAGAIVSQAFGAHNGHDGPNGHPGIDLAVPRGTPIHAPLPGIVVFAGWNDGYGNCVIMDNGGGRSTLYGHQQVIAAHVGDHLKAGQVLGYVDSTGQSTGDHLHFETRLNGQLRNPAQMLPLWQATAGLGSFDPGSVAAAYGVGAPIQLNVKDFTGPGHQHGPWGALVQYKEMAEAAQVAMDAGNSSVGVPLGPQFNGPLQQYAKLLLHQRGWDDQWGEFNALEMSEAGWNVHAKNPSSGAYGLAQALPASKYASAGADWATNGQTQLRWMMQYIATGNNGAAPFRDPRSAWAFHRAHNWYGDGGIFNGAQTIGVGERGPEVVTPLDTNGVSTLAAAFRAALSPADMVALMVGGHQTPVSSVDNSTHVTDHSVNLPGAKIEVVSDDPVDMARKLAKRSAERALTGNGKRS